MLSGWPIGAFMQNMPRLPTISIPSNLRSAAHGSIEAIATLAHRPPVNNTSVCYQHDSSQAGCIRSICGYLHKQLTIS